MTCTVQMCPTRRGERFQNFDESPEEETESTLLKFIGSTNPGMPHLMAHGYNSRWSQVSASRMLSACSMPTSTMEASTMP